MIELPPYSLVFIISLILIAGLSKFINFHYKKRYITLMMEFGIHTILISVLASGLADQDKELISILGIKFLAPFFLIGVIMFSIGLIKSELIKQKR